jgi:flagellar biosynthesis protein FliR
MFSPLLPALAAATAQASAFSATAPIFPENAAPPVARAALVVVLIPILIHVGMTPTNERPIAAMVEGGVTGAAFGMTASMLAGAVKAAGDMIDVALGSPPFIERAASAGPISRIYQLAYALILLESGGLTLLIGGLARAGAHLPHALLSARGLAALGNASISASLTLAGPSLFAQSLATLAAGLFARAAPGVGGVLFGASFNSAFVLLAVVTGAAALWPELTSIVRETVRLFTTAPR